ncbi:MAG: conjugal transfer protein TraI [Candidatus Pedobacter colombiensis]|uniref:Conjugal transfer protein TraI n=1 Tax=Candidatus Pedobacter colombiensis TaxID=3121371 RepID=A0AAJ5W5E0_9SPHI|nr:conjugal transfer protein TraI [Pedobacter sp.]WEK17900.1 MAG: conjugal transfer protein TraI [Pedobacter sp.]
MKKRIMIVIMMLVMLAPVKQTHAQIPILEIIKAGIKKVIRAVDLQIQRQQNKVIWLQNAQKVLENALSKLKLTEISEWTEKQKDLYKTYFEDLKKVKAVISYYQRIREVVEKQKLIVSEYQRAWALVRSDKHFTPSEIEYIGKVYSGILEHSVDNMEELYLVINSFRTQMTDAKRLEMIAGAALKVQQNYIDLRAFNADNSMLSLQRSKSQQEVDMVRKLYGIQ